MVVAINKIDKPGANLDRVKKQLADQGLLVEDWGGDVVSVQVSAKQKTGIDDLLEMILLSADMLDLKSDPSSSRPAWSWSPGSIAHAAGRHGPRAARHDQDRRSVHRRRDSWKGARHVRRSRTPREGGRSLHPRRGPGPRRRPRGREPVPGAGG